MSENPFLKKSLPPEAHSLRSIQRYQAQCEKVAGTTIDLSQVEVIQQANGDKNFVLQYETPQKDFACLAYVDYQNHEMLMKGIYPNEDREQKLAGWAMEDACSVASTTLGKEGLKGQVCQDGVVEPKILKVIHSDSIKKLTKKCAELFDQFGLYHYQEKLGHKVDPKRMQLSSPVGYQYKILYTNQANHFFCEGTVDANSHQMGIRHGVVDAIEKPEYPNHQIEMNDSCSLTRSLMAGNKLGNIPCQDRTRGLRVAEKGLEYSVRGVLTVFSIASIVQLTRWLKSKPTVQRIIEVGKTGGAFLWSGLTVLGVKVAKIGNLYPRLFWLAKKVVPGSLIVWASDKIYGAVRNDYEKWVNQRVGDYIYKNEILAFTKQDRWVIPILFKPIRLGARFLAGNWWNAGVANDRQELKKKFYEEDLIKSREQEEVLRKKLPALLATDNWKKLQSPEALQLLRKPIERGNPNLIREVAKKFDLKSSELIEAMKEIQEAAKFLIKVEQPRNYWANQGFNKDGTLKGGEEYREVLRYLAPNSN